MNRTPNYKNSSGLTQKEVRKRIAFHEAGHAAAIHIGNQQRRLPPVFFQILINPLLRDYQPSQSLGKSDRYIVKVVGGRLIHTLPSYLDEATSNVSTSEKIAYENAFDADIINLLVGPLAEARYIALRDNEPINTRLVNLDSLPYYGGLSDMEIVNQYFECINKTDEQKERKIIDLYVEAFKFVSDRSNWLKITALAEYILTVDKNIIEFEEIITVLEKNATLGAVPI